MRDRVTQAVAGACLDNGAGLAQIGQRRRHQQPVVEQAAVALRMTRDQQAGLAGGDDLVLDLQRHVDRDGEGQATDPESEGTSTGKNEDQQNTGNEEIDEVVFVRSGNKVLLRKVTTGIQDDKHIQILSGLQSGEEVVTAPYSAVSRDLRNNRVIKVVDRDQLFSGEE